MPPGLASRRIRFAPIPAFTIPSRELSGSSRNRSASPSTHRSFLPKVDPEPSVIESPNATSVP